MRTIIFLPADGKPQLATYPFVKELSNIFDEPLVSQCRYCQAKRSGYSSCGGVWIPSFQCSLSCPAPMNPYSFLNFKSCGCGMEEKEMVKGDMFYISKYENGEPVDYTNKYLQHKLEEWEKERVALSQPHRHSMCLIL